MGPILIHTTLLKERCEQREKQVHGAEAGRCPEHKREQRSLSVQLQQGLKQKGTLSPSSWVNGIELKSIQSALGSFYCFIYFF